MNHNHRHLLHCPTLQHRILSSPLAQRSFPFSSTSRPGLVGRKASDTLAPSSDSWSSPGLLSFSSFHSLCASCGPSEKPLPVTVRFPLVSVRIGIHRIVFTMVKVWQLVLSGQYLSAARSVVCRMSIVRTDCRGFPPL